MNIKQKLAQLEDELMELKKQVYDKPVFEGKGLEMVDFRDCEIPFQIAKYTVTELLWAEVMQDKPVDESGKSALPKVNVSWDDTQKFIQKLNEITGKAYRLPTEYEWILTAAVDNTIYSGSDDLDEVGWHRGNCDSIQPVGLKNPNSLGIYDMSGNVWEWCQDWCIKNKYRVFRGGSWDFHAAYARCSYRNSVTPDSRSNDLGFRLARTA